MAEDIKRRVVELTRRCREVQFRTGYLHRTAYGFDATGIRGLCEAVAFPRSKSHLRSLIVEAGELGIPVVPRGAGTGFSGGSVPVEGGLVISTEKMKKVISFDYGEGEIEVESGMVNAELQDHLKPAGMFYPPDPASYRVSTIGGNIAENAGGPRAYKYGVTRRYVRSVSWFTARGDSVESVLEGESSLLAGSEGTLGMIYSARLGVVPIPESAFTFLLDSGGRGRALGLAAALLRGGFRPSVLEFIDSKTFRCVGEYLGISSLLSGGSENDYLFLEVEGTGIETADQESILREFCRSGGLSLVAAGNEKERELLWSLRRSISPSLARRGITKVNEDISLPLGELPAAVGRIHSMAEKTGLDCYIFGHCGDGNLHINIMTDRRNKEEMKRVDEFVEELFDYAAGAGGALSGEHGIGMTKSPYLVKAFSPYELKLQGNIKDLFDPAGLLNPSKYFNAGSGFRGEIPN